MSELPLVIKRIVAALDNLGGRAHLEAIYKEVQRLGYDGGGEDPDKIIRSEIQKHSRDSKRWDRNPDHDLFRHVGKQRSGIWELRIKRAADPEGPSTPKSFRSVRAKPEWLADEEADQGGPSEEAKYVPEHGDRREVVERQLRERRGRQQFRDALRERYRDCCLVTGCQVLAVLEAAHINPYRGEEDNHPANGLLLRSDIHTLFDLDLLGIEPEKLRVELHPEHRQGVWLFCRCHAWLRRKTSTGTGGVETAIRAVP